MERKTNRAMMKSFLSINKASAPPKSFPFSSYSYSHWAIHILALSSLSPNTFPNVANLSESSTLPQATQVWQNLVQEK